MYDRILVPTDGSAAVSEGLDHGLDLAARHDAAVHGIYVVDRRQYIGAPEDVSEDVKETLTHEGESAIGEIEERALAHKLEVETEMLEGVPYKEILGYTDRNDVDVIVVGTFGKTGRDRLATLGSVTERILKHADVPVFVVPVEDES